MTPTNKHAMPIRYFGGVGTTAIVAGGTLSAFSAHAPTELAMWASAYLVLVVGVAQTAFGVALQYLVPGRSAALSLVAFVLYNLGNAGVLAGTAVKHQTGSSVAAVDVGGALLAAAIILMLLATRGARRGWRLVGFYIISGIIVICIPIGLYLSRV